MSRGLGNIERAIVAAMWGHARDVEQWRPGGYHVTRTAWELASLIYDEDADPKPTAAQLRAVYRGMHSLAGKSPCFKVEGGKGRQPLCLSYEIPPPPKRKRSPGAGRKPTPRMSEEELLKRRIALYRGIEESRRKRAAR